MIHHHQCEIWDFGTWDFEFFDTYTASYDEAMTTSDTSTTTISSDIINTTFNPLTSSEAEKAIQSFVKIIEYQTVSATAPETGAYKECAQFLIQELNSIPCLDKIHILEEAPDHSPVVIARWKGVDESLPVVLLNSHIDVVPAIEEDWDVPCFEGLRKDGKIYGRGAQDMKCV